MHDAGADIRTLQAILGHEKIDTTQIYTHVALKKLLETHRRTHPAEQPEQPEQPEPTTETPPDSSDNPPPPAKPKKPAE